MTDCATTTDADGDGAASFDCGGSDCDDADANRFMGNPEVCDGLDHDEDCDPSTFGLRDVDGDGYTDAACCNGTVCGEDCDDHARGVSPDSPEVCNGIDDNCIDGIDEGGDPVDWCRDVDGDRFGAAASDVMLSCPAPGPGWETACTDCNDAVGAINPAAREVAENDRDDDCDGAIDEAATRVVGGGVVSLGSIAIDRRVYVVEDRIEGHAPTCDASGRVCVIGGVLP